MKLTILGLLFLVAVSSLLVAEQSEAYHHKHGGHGHVKIKVWRGPSHGYKKHKHAPFGYHFEIDEKGH